MKRFSVHSNLHKPIQIVFLKIFENCRSPFKNETLHQESPKIGKKTLGVVMYKILRNTKQMANNSLRIPIRIGKSFSASTI
jgi:hypothetical protein